MIYIDKLDYWVSNWLDDSKKKFDEIVDQLKT